MKVVLVHGMWVRDGGKGSIGRMRAQFERLGCEVVVLDYGFWSLFRTYLGDKLETDIGVMRAIRDADLVCAHSRGAVVTDRAYQLLAPDNRARVLVYYSPALNRDTPVPESVTHRYVYHSRHDWLVRLARYAPFNRMGNMGAVGYKGPPTRNTNIDDSRAIRHKHSGWFRGRNADVYACRAFNLYRNEVASNG